MTRLTNTNEGNDVRDNDIKYELIPEILLMAIPTVIFRAYVVTIIWGWFVVPLFGLPLLSIPYVIGLSILLDRYSRGVSGSLENRRHLYGAVLNRFTNGLFKLGFGYIVLQFI